MFALVYISPFEPACQLTHRGVETCLASVRRGIPVRSGAHLHVERDAEVRGSPHPGAHDPGEIVELTGGSSLSTNIALVRHNARLGAAIAREYAAR